MALDEIEVVLDISIYNYIAVKNDSITFGMSLLKRLKGNSICPKYMAHFYPESEVQFEEVTLKKDKRINVILH